MAADQVRRTIVNASLSSIAALFALTMNGALLIYYSPLGALVAWVSFAALLLLGWLVSFNQSEALRRGEELLTNVNTIVFHFIKGIGVLRANGAEDRAFARWGRDFAEMRARAYRSQGISTLFETTS
jgi:ABC-type bacteriocin/lantibiotic exporter with double-glycine peptidase domain